MALERKDRIKDQTTTTGTGTVNLDASAPTGFRTFAAAVTSGATVRYLIESSDQSEWEIGEGVFTDGTPDTLTRATVYSSSNSGSLVNFSAGTKTVSLIFCAADAIEHTPASASGAESIALYEDTDNGSNKVTLKAPTSIASDKTLTLPDITDTVATASGWTPYSAVIPTRATADDPTYVLTFAGVDLTSMLSVGMRVKWTQNSTVRYGIITAIAFSTDTTLTIYGGTDYDVDDTGTYAISGFHYSAQKAPLGFPLDPTKWTVEVENSTESSQATPAKSTWYNIGSLNIVIPIGVWDVYYNLSVTCNDNSTATSVLSTLSTANNSESDADFTSMSGFQIANATNIRNKTAHTRRKTLVLASKTTYYLNEKTETASVASILINETYNGVTDKTIIRAVCAYL
jgi:hypothetical protein